MTRGAYQRGAESIPTKLKKALAASMTDTASHGPREYFS
jgi:hypothetical protein